MEFGLQYEEREMIFIADLDDWFANVYQYWRYNGFATALVMGLVQVINLAFTILLSAFLFAFVDWRAVYQCKDQESCRGLGSYYRNNFLSERSKYVQDAFTLAYIVIFALYWLWSCGATLMAIREAWDMRQFYHKELNISDQEVQTIDWNEVVRRLGDLQECGRAPWTMVQTGTTDVTCSKDTSPISAHDIASRIMRKENYLIALLNANILDLTLPAPELVRNFSPSFNAYVSRARLTKTLEWALHSCLLDHMFSKRSIIRRTFLSDKAALRQRFVWAGLIYVIFVPFVAAFMTMHFFLLHAQEWRMKKNYFGPREWSPIATWSFREFNELPHVFDARLAACREPADAYLRLFQKPVFDAFARCLAFVSGALVALLLAVTAALDSGDAALLYIKFGDRNLLWFVGAASATFAVSRAMMSTPMDANTTFFSRENLKNNGTDVAEHIMQRITEHIHCFPEEWRGHANSGCVRKDFACAFCYKVWLFFDEIMSVVFAPMVLCFSLPTCATNILDFIRDNTVDTESLGSVLGHSLFDFTTHDDLNCGGSTDDSKRIVRGKMQKSFVNFTLSYPEWAKRNDYAKRSSVLAHRF